MADMSEIPRPTMMGSESLTMRWISLLAASTMLVACHGSGQNAGPDRPGQPTPTARAGTIDTVPASTPTPTASPTAVGPTFRKVLAPGPTRVRVARGDLETGAPPRLEYVAAFDSSQVVVKPDGQITATLEVAPEGNEGYRHVSFAPYASGWLTGFDVLGPTATLIRPDGSLGDSLGLGPYDDVFSSADRREIVFSFEPWNGSHTQVAVLGSDGVRRLGPAISTAGFLGDHEVVASTRAGVFRVDRRDLARAPVPGISTATVVSSRRGWLIGEAMGAHGVFDARSGEPILGSPDHQLVGFSPSGRLVVGYQHTSDRLVMAVAEVKTGTVLRAFSMRAPSPPLDVVWEDEQTFLIDFVRFSVDGTVERAPVLGQSAPGVPSLLPPPTS